MREGRGRHPNLVLRSFRERVRQESRDEFARAVTAEGTRLGEHVACDARLVARWEDGSVACPRYAYQRVLQSLTGCSAVDLGFADPRSVEPGRTSRSAAASLGGAAAPLPGAAVLSLPSDWPVGRVLALPRGRVVPASVLMLTEMEPKPCTTGWTGPHPADRGSADFGLRSLAVALSPDDQQAYEIEANPLRSDDRRTTAYRLDALTLGILWAVCGVDDALLADDTTLAEAMPRLRHHDRLATSPAGEDAAEGLHPVTQMWLGSDFCARHIRQHLDVAAPPPVFWTREQRGEEASTWLVFRHKIAYLEAIRRHYAPAAPLERVFCIPGGAVQASPLAERVLLLLSAALMEAMHVAVRVTTDPSYASVDGFVLSPTVKVIVANWLRADGLWQVDALGRPAGVRRYHDTVRSGRADSLTTSDRSVERLRVLAEYLEIDWTWVRGRCAVLGSVGIEGLIRPRSRLLATRGVTAAVRHLGAAR